MFEKQYIPFLHAAETRICVANEALQLHGGCRYNPDHDIQRVYRDARIVGPDLNPMMGLVGKGRSKDDG